MVQRNKNMLADLKLELACKFKTRIKKKQPEQ